MCIMVIPDEAIKYMPTVYWWGYAIKRLPRA